MYTLADSAEIESFPGVSEPNEEPESPDMMLRTAQLPAEECVDRIVLLLKAKGVIG